MFASCKLGNCNIGNGENFINFDLIEDLVEYHFKLVWNDGKAVASDGAEDTDYELEWKQADNPLTMTDADMKPYGDPRQSPSGDKPLGFNGLSVSSKQTATLLDGQAGLTNWWFSVGYKLEHCNDNDNCGNPAYKYQDGGKYRGKTASKTQLFVNVPATTTTLTITTTATTIGATTTLPTTTTAATTPKTTTSGKI